MSLVTRIVGREEVSNELIYYNCDITNANTFDRGTNSDPVVKFEETRSTPILSDASKYNFSIVRFTLDGPNKNIPVFIPIVQPIQQLFDYDANLGTAPAGIWNNTSVYGLGAIVSRYSASGPGGTAVQCGPYYISLIGGNVGNNPLTSPTAWSPYQLPSYATIYSITLAGTIGGVQIAPIQKYVRWYPEKTDVIPGPLTPSGALVGGNQPFSLVQTISQPYWWATTYSHWVDCVNATLRDIWTQLVATYPNLQTIAPVLVFNTNENTFTMTFDSNGFGDNRTATLQAETGSTTLQSPYVTDQRLNWSATAFAGPPIRPASDENFHLYFNSNMQGLFTNFNAIYIGDDLPVATDFGRDYLLIVNNQQTAVYNPYQLTPGAKVGTIADIVSASTPFPNTYPKVLYVLNQDFASTSSLWSPCSAIVFTSTLLPTTPENSGAPYQLGLGDNTALNSTSNAFQPIITDIAIPMGASSDYRQFISYTPTAEYRLTSLGTSSQDIRAIDIQIYWKSRLTSELIPLRMFNQSSVHLKILFRRRNGGQ